MTADRIGVAVAAVVAAVIALATLTPSVGADASVPGLDKLAHLLAFAALTAPLGLTAARSRAWVVVLAALYGAAIEVIQPHVGRSAEWLDLCADILGAYLGIVLGDWLRRRRHRA